MDQQNLKDLKKTSNIQKIEKVEGNKFSPKNSKSPTGALKRKEQDQKEEV